MNNELPKTKIDERTGIEYHLEGDYYIPNLAMPKQEKIVLNKYGRMRLKLHSLLIFIIQYSLYLVFHILGCLILYTHHLLLHYQPNTLFHLRMLIKRQLLSD